MTTVSSSAPASSSWTSRSLSSVDNRISWFIVIVLSPSSWMRRDPTRAGSRHHPSDCRAAREKGGDDGECNCALRIASALRDHRSHEKDHGYGRAERHGEKPGHGYAKVERRTRSRERKQIGTRQNRDLRRRPRSSGSEDENPSVTLIIPTHVGRPARIRLAVVAGVENRHWSRHLARDGLASRRPENRLARASHRTELRAQHTRLWRHGIPDRLHAPRWQPAHIGVRGGADACFTQRHSQRHHDEQGRAGPQPLVGRSLEQPVHAEDTRKTTRREEGARPPLERPPWPLPTRRDGAAHREP